MFVCLFLYFFLTITNKNFLCLCCWLLFWLFIFMWFCPNVFVCYYLFFFSFIHSCLFFFFTVSEELKLNRVCLLLLKVVSCSLHTKIILVYLFQTITFYVCLFVWFLFIQVCFLFFVFLLLLFQFVIHIFQFEIVCIFEFLNKDEEHLDPIQ